MTIGQAGGSEKLAFGFSWSEKYLNHQEKSCPSQYFLKLMNECWERFIGIIGSVLLKQTHLVRSQENL